MNEWFKKTFGTIKEKWGKWSILQKGILVGIIVVVVAALVIFLSLSARPATVRLFNSPVTDANDLERIRARLDDDKINTYVNSEGYISVDNEAIARKYRSKLIAEGLEPARKDPYSLFDTQKWTRTDFDNKVDWQRAQEAAVENHIRQLDGIRDVSATLALPDDALFSADQNPTTASVILWPQAGSDILENRTQVRGIMRLIMRSVEGLTEDNITIMNGVTGDEISNFEGMEAIDRTKVVTQQQKEIRRLESEYSRAVLNALQSTYTVKRVKIANMKIDMDWSEKTSSSTKYSGIEIKPDNPDTVYDDSITVESLKISETTVDKTYTGTIYNPEGPAGVAGQNPPVYDDMSNAIGQQTEKGATTNYALNRTDTTETVSPSTGRVTISVNIDGTWQYPLYDPETHKVRISDSGGYERNYIPISDEELAKVTRLVQDAVGYNAKRGDRVTVTNIAFDHQDEFKAEDARFIKAQQTRKTIIFVLIGIAVVLLVFIIFRFISREIERRRRLREEEMLRRQQQEREQALWDAKEQGMEVTLSVEEQKRAKLQEEAIALAKEHPEDVAMLIRTWLMEE